MGGGKPKPPSAWRAAYPNATIEVINRETYLPFVLPPEEVS
jgi:hypothetical protein